MVNRHFARALAVPFYNEAILSYYEARPIVSME
jgi:hypothetical protein